MSNVEVWRLNSYKSHCCLRCCCLKLSNRKMEEYLTIFHRPLGLDELAEIDEEILWDDDAVELDDGVDDV